MMNDLKSQHKIKAHLHDMIVLYDCSSLAV